MKSLFQYYILHIKPYIFRMVRISAKNVIENEVEVLLPTPDDRILDKQKGQLRQSAVRRIHTFSALVLTGMRRPCVARCCRLKD